MQYYNSITIYNEVTLKKIILTYDSDWNRYWIKDDSHVTNNSNLYNLPLALSKYWNDHGISIDIIDGKTVFIYAYDNFKRQVDIEFKTEEEKIKFDELYEQYYDKRWDEMPQIELSIEDWELLQQNWTQIKQVKSKYVVFTLDDSAPLDKVEVIGKDELSEQDIVDIKLEHDTYLQWEKAKQAYMKDHLDYSYFWRGPQDNEYDEDILKYWGKNPEDYYREPRVYTKQEVAEGIKQRLQEGEYPELIGYWLNRIEIDADETWMQGLYEYQNSLPISSYSITEQQLDELADKILMGKSIKMNM